MRSIFHYWEEGAQFLCSHVAQLWRCRLGSLGPQAGRLHHKIARPQAGRLHHKVATKPVLGLPRDCSALGEARGIQDERERMCVLMRWRTEPALLISCAERTLLRDPRGVGVTEGAGSPDFVRIAHTTRSG